jgi:hypothetical protein
MPTTLKQEGGRLAVTVVIRMVPRPTTHKQEGDRLEPTAVGRVRVCRQFEKKIADFEPTQKVPKKLEISCTLSSSSGTNSKTPNRGGRINFPES